MIFNRVWAMPNKFTFQIPAIRDLINKYVSDGIGWIDPFCGESAIAEIRNDLNPDRPCSCHMSAKDFCNELPGNHKGILFDPPYSNRQIKECYEGIGLKFTQDDSQGLFSKEKKLFAPKIETGGLALTFGWNSSGFGKGLGFEMVEILLVCHGGAHNDTICTVERKFTNEIF